MFIFDKKFFLLLFNFFYISLLISCPIELDKDGHVKKTKIFHIDDYDPNKVY